MFKGFKKISTKIFLGIFASTVIVFSLSSLTEYFYTKSILTEMVRSLVEHSFSAAYNSLDAEIRPVIVSAENTAYFLLNFEFTDSDILEIQKTTLNQFDDCLGFGVCFFDKTKSSSNLQYLNADTLIVDASSHKYDAVVSEIQSIIDSPTKYPLDIKIRFDTISLYYYGSGKLKDVCVYYDFPLSNFIGILNGQTKLMDSRHYLFDENKEVIKSEIGRTDSLSVLIFERESHCIKNYIESDTSGLIIPEYTEYNRAVFISELNGTDLTLATTMDIEEVIHQFKNFFQITFFVSLLAILILAYVLQRIIVRLLKPITELTNLSKKIEAGSLNTLIPEYDGDGETAQLSNTLRVVQDRMKTYVSGFNATLKEKRALEHELHIASKIQSDMIPVPDRALTELPEIDLYARISPAKGVAGDFYDYFFLNEKTLFFLIGDVSGKGIPAALFMVKVITLIELEARKNSSLSTVFNTVNEQLCLKNEEGMFATAICGLINIETGELTLCDAGHNTPIMGLNGQEFSYHEIEKNMPLGMMPDREYKETNLQLSKNDTLVFYTDGFPECMAKGDAMLGEGSLIEELKDNSKAELQTISNKLWNLIKNFRQGFAASDDTTLLLLRFLGK